MNLSNKTKLSVITSDSDTSPITFKISPNNSDGFTPNLKSKSKFSLENYKTNIFTQELIETEESGDSSVDSSQDMGTLVDKINDLFYNTNYFEYSKENENKENIDLKNITIDDFDIIEVISQGGFGIVFLAKKKTTGDIFAIKKINIKYLEKKNWSKFIKNEQMILNHVNNDFIVKCYYSFSDGENIYFVMEYLNGGDLSHLLSKFKGLNEEVKK